MPQVLCACKIPFTQISGLLHIIMGPRNEEAAVEQTLLEQTNYSTSNTTFNLPQRIFPRMKVREKRKPYFHTSFSPSHPQTTTSFSSPYDGRYVSSSSSFWSPSSSSTHQKELPQKSLTSSRGGLPRVYILPICRWLSYCL
jgi:hypothetical protein